MNKSGSRRTIADSIAAIPPGEIRDIMQAAADVLYTPLQQQIVSAPFLELSAADMEFIKTREEMGRFIIASTS